MVSLPLPEEVLYAMTEPFLSYKFAVADTLLGMLEPFLLCTHTQDLQLPVLMPT
jgi:hypothetical protein